MLAIAAGLTGGLLSIGLNNGMVEQKMRNSIETQTAHLQVHRQGFRQNSDIKLHIPEPEEVLPQIQRTVFVEAVSGRTVVAGMLASPNASAGVQFTGVDTVQEKRVSTLHQKLEEGSYLGGTKRNPVLISRKLADKLQVRTGSKIVATMQDVQGEIVGAAFKVAGIFRTSSSGFDEGQVFVLRENLQQLTGQPGMIHEFGILSTGLDRVTETREGLQKAFAGTPLEVATWQEIQPELAYLNEATIQTNVLFLLIILLALAFGILNTMLMAIFERMKEIGVLMAVGMNRARIFGMILLETLLLTLMGAALGLLATTGLLAWLGQRGIDLSIVGQGLAAYGIDEVIYPAIEPSFYLLITGMVVLIALLSALYPAWKAIKLQPVEAMSG